MPAHIGIGFSNDTNIVKAAQDAAFQSKTNLGENTIDLAVILSTIHYSPEQTLPVFNKVLNKAKIIGCSTAGIILNNSIETRGISVLTVSSDENSFGIGAVNNITIENAKNMGISLAQNCLSDFGKGIRQLFLMLFDGTIEEIPALIQGTQEVLGNIFPIAGAGSCDDFHFTNNFHIFQNKILRHSCAGIMLGGKMNIATGSSHGWKPLGKPRIVDKSDGNIIKSIDGEKASSLYKDFFGQSFASFGSTHLERNSILYPLGIFIKDSKEFLLRHAIKILENGNIVCQGNVPEKSEIHIMIGNKDSCKYAAFQAAQEAKNNLLGKDAILILVIESMARLKILGKSTQQEIDEIKKVFGNNIPIIGMYANGEISPLQASEKQYKRSVLHSESIVIVAIS